MSRMVERSGLSVAEELTSFIAGAGQPNGYAEPLLHVFRQKVKQQSREPAPA